MNRTELSISLPGGCEDESEVSGRTVDCGSDWFFGPPSRWLLAHCQALLYRVGDSLTSSLTADRCCISFILRTTLGSLLGEKAQIAAAKEICLAIGKQKRAVVDERVECAMDCSIELGERERERRREEAERERGRERRETEREEKREKGRRERERRERERERRGERRRRGEDERQPLLNTVFSVLLHPSVSARLAAAWYLRCAAVALPSQGAVLLDRCAERLNALKSCLEAVAGYSAAIAALLGAVQHCSLGIPHTKGRVVTGLAEDLLRSATQNSRISIQHRLAGCCCPPSLNTLESFGIVLKQLVTDLTGPENLVCSELTLLPPLRVVGDDLAQLGPALQDMDQRYIEEQVCLRPKGAVTINYKYN
ncbi:unnamed protein product [Coregonus sp. 'balchen']|nr:unnamed protein product [Coregonus sp. 'balchen']